MEINFSNAEEQEKMKANNLSTTDKCTVSPDGNAGPLSRGPVLALLAFALAISGCQQLPPDHWSRPCGQRTGADCYGAAVPPPVSGR
jgi:hypothetical protein